MNYFFSFRISSGELSSIDTNFSISTSFNKVEVVNDVRLKLKNLNLILENDHKITFKDGNLYMEGLAHDYEEPSITSLIFIH